MNPFNSEVLCKFRNRLYFTVMIKSPSLNTHAGYHPMSAVRECLFNVFTAVLHTCSPSPPSATWERAMPWWQGTNMTKERKYATRTAYKGMVMALNLVETMKVWWFLVRKGDVRRYGTGCKRVVWGYSLRLTHDKNRNMGHASRLARGRLQNSTDGKS
jgi:hypothetical protein